MHCTCLVSAQQNTSAVQALHLETPKCKTNRFVSIKAIVSDGADIQHFPRLTSQLGTAIPINNYRLKEIEQQSRPSTRSELTAESERQMTVRLCHCISH